MSAHEFPTRLLLRLAVFPAALVIVGIVKSTRGDCSSGSSYTPGPSASLEEITATRTRVQAMDKARRDALVAARDTVVPRPDLGACPVSFTPSAANKKTGILPTESTAIYDLPRWNPRGNDELLGNFHDELLAIERIGIAFADEVGEKPGPRSLQFESDARRSTVAKRDMDEAVSVEASPNDFQLVIDREIEGSPGEGDSFEGGALFGRFYVWDHAKVAIVCAAGIFATSSDHLRFKTEPGSAGREKLAGILRSDLREQAIAQAKERLHVAGAPKAAEDATEAAGGADGGAHRDGGARTPPPGAGDAGARSAPKPR